METGKKTHWFFFNYLILRAGKGANGLAKSSDITRRPHVVFVIAVWNSVYVEKFLKFALPTLLAPGNLPSAAELAVSRFLFVTTEADIPAIRGDALFTRLANLLPTSFVTFDPHDNRYTALSKAHEIAAESAVKRGEAAVFLAPDAIVANGSLSHVISKAREGNRAVMATGLRLNEESLAPILRILPRDENGALSLEPRAMTKLALAHLHPEIERYIWGSKNFTGCPHLCMWPGPNQDGFLIRAFHLHPLLINFDQVQALSTLNHSTIDGNFLGHVVGRWSDIGVVSDSDDISIYSLTPNAQRQEYFTYGPASADALRAMAYSGQVNPLHRYFFTTAIRLHVKDVNAQWTSLEEETGRFAYQALDLNAGMRLAAVAQQMAGRELLKLLAIKISQKLSRRVRRDLHA